MADVVLKSVTSSKLLISDRKIVVFVHYAQTLETNPQSPRRTVVTEHSISILRFRCSMYSIAEPTAPFILATCAVLLMNCKCTLDNIQLQIRVVLKQKSSREFVPTRDVRGLVRVCIYVSNKILLTWKSGDIG